MFNPFICGMPVSSEQFVGRYKELRFIVNRIRTQGQGVAIVGEPRSGKTSLLTYLKAESEQLHGDDDSNLLFSFRDISALPPKCDQAQFWREALMPLREKLKKEETEPVLVKAYEICEQNNFNNFDLESVFEQMQRAGLRLVLLLDEFDAFLHHQTLNNAGFFGGFRSLISRSHALAPVIAARQSVSALNEKTQALYPTGSPYFNVFHEIVLGAFDNENASFLLERAKGRFTSEDRQLIVRYTGGHPDWLQAAASALWEAYEYGEIGHVTIMELLEKNVYNRIEETVEDSWRLWSREIREALIIIALIQSPNLLNDRAFKRGSLIDDLGSLRSEINDLDKKGVIEKNITLESGWKIRAEGVLLWLKRDLKHILRNEEELTNWLRSKEADGVEPAGEATREPKPEPLRKEKPAGQKMILRYLHLSDLHFKALPKTSGRNWTAQSFEQNMVAKSLVETVHMQVKDGNPLDFIIITGDIAFSGKQEEYEVAETFCQALLEAANLHGDRLYLVPGNHDVDRNAMTPYHPMMYRFHDQEEISVLLSDPGSACLVRKFAAFNDFVERVTGTRYFNENNYYLVRTITLKKNQRSFRINLAGFNSALFAGYDGDDKQKLALGSLVVDSALQNFCNDAELSIGFLHHPFTAFHPDEGVCQTRLKQELDLILAGHVHQPDNIYTHDSRGEYLLINAGAAYESRKSANSFNIVEIDLSTGEGQVRFFKYLLTSHVWVRDNEINPPEGVFCFKIKSSG